MLRMRRLIVLVNSFSGAKGMWFFFFFLNLFTPLIPVFCYFLCTVALSQSQPFKIQIQTTKYLSLFPAACYDECIL